MALEVVRSVAKYDVLFRERFQFTSLRTVPVGGMRLWQGSVSETVYVSEGMLREAGRGLIRGIGVWITLFLLPSNFLRQLQQFCTLSHQHICCIYYLTNSITQATAILAHLTWVYVIALPRQIVCVNSARICSTSYLLKLSSDDAKIQVK